ncbi:MAG: redoxin domain-containing protein [Phycisphaerae bacterium]|nr:redoxin domain-containing protein [Phycisphaerae bacterium]
MMMRMVCAVGIVLRLAGGAWGQTATSPSTQPAKANPVFASYADLVDHFTEKQQRMARELAQEHKAALEAFVARATGDDLEQACPQLIALAMELGDHAGAIAAADRFAREFASSESAVFVAGARVRALAGLGKLDEARKAWMALAESTDLTGWAPVFEAGMAVGTELVLVRQIAEARAIYEEIRNRTRQVPQIGAIIARQLDGLKWIGKTPPAIEGNDLAGKPVSFEEYKGRVVLLDFWATYCSPCITEMPNLVRLHKRFHRRGFDVIGISLDPNVSVAKSFLERNPLPWRQVADMEAAQGANATNYGVEAIPMTFLIGRDGTIVYVGAGAEELQALLGRLLGDDSR